MQKVYGIYTGEYSDWNCLGFTTDELYAEKYCTAHDDCYIIPLDDMTGKENLKNIKPRYLYLFKEDFTDFYHNSQGEVDTENRKNEVIETRWGITRIEVAITEKSREKAVKIAQDLYAKWKAEQKGL